MTVNKIAVAGTGYVGLSLATLLAQHNKVVAVDIVQEKVDLINNKKSPVQDKEYEPVLQEETFFNSVVEKDLLKFKSECDIIIANRNSEELADVSGKIYTRDLMGRD